MNAGENAHAPPLRVHGLDLSYFTGKIEGYLRLKRIAYERVEMDAGSFRALARRTGVAQMPHIEMPDGAWLTDTPRIIDALEHQHPEPSLTPDEAEAAFAADVLEAYGDEWLWRPALYYRWAFAEDARLMSARLAGGLLRDAPAPFAVRRWIILARQRREYLRRDGVTRATGPAIERLFEASYQALERLLEDRPFLMGARPTRADLGFFGPFFRHFASDPTPLRRLRAHAPRTLAWVARIWAGDADFAAPARFDLAAASVFANSIETEFLPYLVANAAACEAGERHVRFRSHGADFKTPPSPYRAWRLARLKERFAGLDDAARAAVRQALGAQAAALLAAPAPQIPARAPGVVDRAWRPLGRG